MKKTTAIIYTRVSTLRQAEEGLPIESQIEQCHMRAATLGAEVVQVFSDAGLSGRTDDRPGFQDAVAYCKSHHVDYFICWSTSRFARNRVDAGFHKLQLKKRGTRVVYVTLDLDSDTDSGWMIESILEVVDEHYSRQIGADTLRSMTKNARDGYFNGGRVPFGYAAVPEGKRKRLAILEEEARTVRDIFDLYVSGMGCKAISMELNGSARLRRGFKKWNKNLVTAVLKSEVYTGKTVFNRTNHLTGKIRPRDKWIVTQSHPAIIEEEIFMDVQKLFEERAPTGNGGSPRSQFVFTGLLRCEKCGLAMRTESGTGRKRRYYYYNCQSAQKGAGCSTHRISAPEFDEWLIDTILDRILTRERLVETIAEIHELTSEYLRNRDRQMEALARNKRDVEARLKNVLEILEIRGKNALNLTELLESLGRLKAEQNDLAAQLAELENEEIPDSRTFIDDNDVQAMAEMMRDIVTTTRDVNKLRRFFGSFIERIMVTDDGLRIEYQADKLVNQEGFDVVRSKTWWLPDQGSNLGPAD